MVAVARQLWTRNFTPFFIVQLTGAYNDNVFRNALVALLTFRVVDLAGFGSAELIAASAGIFILPFLLFSATGGTLADRFPRHTLIRYIKLAEVVLMALTWLGFVLESIGFLFAILFLTGLQSALFGPIKYAILPSLLSPQNLLIGNAWVAAGTFATILAGTLCGTLLMAVDGAVHWVPSLLVLFAAIGYASSRYIPTQTPAGASSKDPLNPIHATGHILHVGLAQRPLAWLIVAISGFWMLGVGVLTQLPVLVRDSLGGDEVALAMALGIFSLGVGLGALLCNLCLRGRSHPRLAPAAALLIAVGFWLLAQVEPVTAEGVYGLLETPQGQYASAALLFLAIAGGFYIVPLYALLQQRAENAQRARVIACNNIVNALAMALASGITIMIYQSGGTIETLWLSLAIFTAVGGIVLLNFTGGSLRRLLLRPFIQLETCDKWDLPHGCLVFTRHANRATVWALAATLQGRLEIHAPASMPRPGILARFVIFKHRDTSSNDVQRPSPDARSRAAIILPDPEHPELLLTLMRRTCAHATHPIAVASVSGPARRGLLRRPHIRVHVQKCTLPPHSEDEDVAQTARRESYVVYDSLCAAEYRVRERDESTLQSVYAAAKRYGMGQTVLDDQSRKLNYRDLLRAIQAMALLLCRAVPQEEDTVGVLLPNVATTPIVFLGLHAAARTPVMLNYTAGNDNVRSACNTAQLRYVLSSRQFIEKAELQSLAEAVEGQCTVVYLEDLVPQLTLGLKLRAAWRALHPPQATPVNETAVVLFTSGSEGHPKGVVLSHRNLQRNRCQVESILDFTSRDRVLLSLPLYHSFALGVGLLMPLTLGMRCLLYPSPLHYKQIPNLIQSHEITIFFSTDTFLNNYAQHASKTHFQSLRLLIAGAEPLKPSTHELWKTRFGVDICQGYGVTETSPAVSANTPICAHPESVGRLMPAQEARLAPLEGDDTPDRGRLMLRGPNVMRGYWMPDAPRVLVPPPDGWHDTGDIAEFDAIGFLYLRGRAKRFAKIGGEMVSLAHVEQKVAEAWTQYAHHVCAVRHSNRGETLVLLTTHPQPDHSELREELREKGLSNLAHPRHLLSVEELPLLGSGKVDLRRAQELAQSVVLD